MRMRKRLRGEPLGGQTPPIPLRRCVRGLSRQEKVAGTSRRYRYWAYWWLGSKVYIRGSYTTIQELNDDIRHIYSGHYEVHTTRTINPVLAKQEIADLPSNITQVMRRTDTET